MSVGDATEKDKLSQCSNNFPLELKLTVLSPVFYSTERCSGYFMKLQKIFSEIQNGQSKHQASRMGRKKFTT